LSGLGGIHAPRQYGWEHLKRGEKAGALAVCIQVDASQNQQTRATSQRQHHPLSIHSPTTSVTAASIFAFYQHTAVHPSTRCWEAQSQYRYRDAAQSQREIHRANLYTILIHDIYLYMIPQPLSCLSWPLDHPMRGNCPNLVIVILELQSIHVFGSCACLEEIMSPF
jgi:hypothetical protein